MKRLICILLAIIMFAALAACGEKKPSETDDKAKTESATGDAVTEPSEDGIDYLVLVNKENKLPDGWEEKLETVTVKNSLGDDVEVEKKAYEAYLALKEALAAEGVEVDLDSARRSVATQQRIWDDFMEEYGEVYTKRTVATPGYSEHHTGLALDLYLIIDGKDVYLNEEMVTYTDVWAKIHAKLAEHGFILRYLEGKEAITGYGYEPWHIRYVDSVEIATEITDKGITLEEYLNKLPVGNVAPPAETETETATEAATEPATEAVAPSVYGDDPAAAIVGAYAAVSVRATAKIEPADGGNVRITINGSNGAFNYTEWTMSGAFDPASLTVAFEDEVIKNVTIDGNGSVGSEDVRCTDGVGRIVFEKDEIKFYLEDEQSGLSDIEFVLKES